jgi:hypothetical protein
MVAQKKLPVKKKKKLSKKKSTKFLSKLSKKELIELLQKKSAGRPNKTKKKTNTRITTKKKSSNTNIKLKRSKAAKKGWETRRKNKEKQKLIKIVNIDDFKHLSADQILDLWADKKVQELIASGDLVLDNDYSFMVELARIHPEEANSGIMEELAEKYGVYSGHVYAVWKIQYDSGWFD